MQPALQFLRKKRVLLLITFLLVIPTILISINRDKPSVLSSTEEMLNVQLSITPELDFSLFAPYSVSATSIPVNPQSIQLNLRARSGEDSTCWDFYADGTCASEDMTFNMTYDSGSNSYQRNIYPDYIYPEIFFAPSEISWANSPLETPTRRNAYHILHMNNPFTMVREMNFWIEVNGIPNSTLNSADLEVYLVEKGHDITYFNSDWRNLPGVELVGTFSKSSAFHHTHTVNSSHRLVRLSTDSEGKVGNKALDISGEFWVLFYSNSPNNARGWNFRYHPDTLCTNSNRWYVGNISGWQTTPSFGCPDAHIHISRKNISYTNTVEASVTATYDTGTFTSPTTTFTFADLPNLPPNGSSFLAPTVGSRYSDSLNISWNPTTDPNTGDTITYSIYITEIGGSPVTLVENTTETTYILDTNLYTDGEYILTGEVCDNLGLCTPFGMDSSFYIDNVIIPESISSLTISSSNENGTWAKTGDTVTISFVTTGEILTPDIEVYTGGDPITDSIDISNVLNTWEASFQILYSDSDGEITFVISSPYLDKQYYQTTNQSQVVVDLTPPSAPTFSLESGQYIGEQEISISSETNSITRFTLDGSSPTCTNGTEYQQPINILIDSTIKAVSCDILGNSSNIVTSEYEIKEYISSSSVTSSNINTEYAKEGDIVTLTFLASNTIFTPTVLFSVEDSVVSDEITVIEGDTPYSWEASFTVSSTTSNGLLSFTISSPTLHTVFTETTDFSRVIIDTVKPTKPLSSISTGTYSSAEKVTLTSNASIIRYTLDSTTPTCSSGYLYSSTLNILTSKVLKAVSCDIAGNISDLSSYVITIFPDTLTIDTSEQEEEESTDEQEDNIETEENTDEQEEDIDTEEGENIEYVEIDKLKYTTLIKTEDNNTVFSVVKIRVIDNKDRALKNREVTIYSQPQTAKTNIDGIVSFYDIPVGEHTLSLSYDSEEYRERIEIKEPNILGIREYHVIEVKIDKRENYTYIVSFIISVCLAITYVISRKINKKESN